MYHHPQVLSEYHFAIQTGANVLEVMVPQQHHAQLLTLLLYIVHLEEYTNKLSFPTQEWKNHGLSKFCCSVSGMGRSLFSCTSERSPTSGKHTVKGMKVGHSEQPCPSLTLQSGPARCSLSFVTTREFYCFILQVVVGVYQVSKDYSAFSSL